ncbi:MAG: hypothetical protein QOC77_248 [Thermoleophilaceae bacterium]|nr:hypothetical protein [Thermoleophilaceae bacterium]
MKRLSLFLSVAALALMAAISAQAADVTVGQSGWNWGNPQPQGNTLRAVEFAGARGFAAGEFGTLLRTDDRGRSWTGIPTGTTAAITHISIPDASTVVVGSGCVLRRSDDGGTSFAAIPVGCKPGIASLAFPSAQTGYLLLADGAVSKTTDGGATFTAGGSIPGTEAAGAAGATDSPTDVFFTDDNTGFAVTRGASGGAVYRTSDGGSTWFQRTTSPQALNGLYFPDPATGYAVGAANTVLKTTDGGETWAPKPVPDSVPSSDLMSIRCGTTTNCMIATESGERVLHTTNGGNGANGFGMFNPAAQKIFALAFSTASQAVAVGDHGTTVLSTNADASTPSFVPVADQPLSGSFSRLRSAVGSLVLAPGESGKLARSSDGGRHWTTMQVPTSEDLRDAWFVDGNVGFVLDASGQVERTTDGGDGWSEMPTGTTARPNALWAADQSVVLLFGPKGVRRATSSVDPSFSPVTGTAASSATLTDYDRTAGSALFAYGRKALIVSNDLGASWKAVNGPTKNARYRSVDFLTGRTGFVLLESGRLFRTGNGGRSWTELLGTGSSRGYAVSFGDARNGYMAVDRFAGGGPFAWVLRTSDAGATWRPQLIGPDPLDVRGLVAPDAASAFGLAGGSQLFYTATGGDPGAIPSTITLKPKRRAVTHTQLVRVDGRLSPAVPGASVAVLARNANTHAWTVAARPQVAADGTFTLLRRISHTTQLVAQWRGDIGLSGDGSPAVTIAKEK